MRKRAKPYIDLGVIEMQPCVASVTEPDDLIPVGIYKMYPDVLTPKYATKRKCLF
jgi:hypothetical protein